MLVHGRSGNTRGRFSMQSAITQHSTKATCILGKLVCDCPPTEKHQKVPMGTTFVSQLQKRGRVADTERIKHV